MLQLKMSGSFFETLCSQGTTYNIECVYHQTELRTKLVKNRKTISLCSSMVRWISLSSRQRVSFKENSTINHGILDFLPFLPRFLVPVRMSDAAPLPTRLLRWAALEPTGPKLAHGDGPWPVLQPRHKHLTCTTTHVASLSTFSDLTNYLNEATWFCHGLSVFTSTGIVRK